MALGIRIRNVEEDTNLIGGYNSTTLDFYVFAVALYNFDYFYYFFLTMLLGLGHYIVFALIFSLKSSVNLSQNKVSDYRGSDTST